MLPASDFLLKITRSSWLPLNLRRKILNRRSIHKGIDFQIKIFEASYRGTTGNFVDDKTYLFGMYESATIRLMRAILADNRRKGKKAVLMDIGTNTGLHLVACAPLADAAFGFEPWEPVRQRAQLNLDENGFSHVRLLDFGLSDGDAELAFSPPLAGNLGVGTFAIQDGRTAKGSPNTVPLWVRRGDAVAQEMNIAPTLVKIDTEGFEPQVLSGLTKTLHAHRPAIVIELTTESVRDFPTEAALHQVLPVGYRLFGLTYSQEYPRLTQFKAGGRFENVLAWPEDGPVPLSATSH